MFRVLLSASILLTLVSLSKCQNDSDKGSCPPPLAVDLCQIGCSATKPCVNEAQLCCPTTCGGHMCVDAMTKRQNVDLVKAGNCPKSPGGDWVCTYTCTGDSDCPGPLKCCPNRCEALTCMRPEVEENDENNNKETNENTV